MNDRPVLDEQIQYFRARANEYDQWFLRMGRYDRGEDHTRQWNAEVAEVLARLRAAEPVGRVLELACGTGLWTRHLVERATQVTAIDSSPEVLEICGQRIAAAGRSEILELQESDLFLWSPTTRYDFIFFGFWLSHVPRDRFNAFWSTVESALAPGGRVFFVDSAFTQESKATDHAQTDQSGLAERKLNDGTKFEIVKVFYDPKELTRELEVLGWAGSVSSTNEFFIHGQVERPVRGG